MEEEIITLARKHLSTTIQLLSRIQDEETDAIEQAAGLIADAIEQGQCLFAFGCNRSSLQIQDLVYRAGGFMLDEFSASPKLIPELKQTIRRFSSNEALKVAQEAIPLPNAKEAREYLQIILKKADPGK